MEKSGTVCITQEFLIKVFKKPIKGETTFYRSIFKGQVSEITEKSDELCVKL